jgi:hypothetical protein
MLDLDGLAGVELTVRESEVDSRQQVCHCVDRKNYQMIHITDLFDLRPSVRLLGSIGELIAAVATVLTLAYLAAQVRRNTQMLRASTRSPPARKPAVDQGSRTICWKRPVSRCSSIRTMRPSAHLNTQMYSFGFRGLHCAASGGHPFTRWIPVPRYL